MQRRGVPLSTGSPAAVRAPRGWAGALGVGWSAVPPPHGCLGLLCPRSDVQLGEVYVPGARRTAEGKEED